MSNLAPPTHAEERDAETRVLDGERNEAYARWRKKWIEKCGMLPGEAQAFYAGFAAAEKVVGEIAWDVGYEHAHAELKRRFEGLNSRINNALKWCYSHDNPDAMPGSFEDLMLSEAAHVANILKGTRTHE